MNSHTKNFLKDNYPRQASPDHLLQRISTVHSIVFWLLQQWFCCDSACEGHWSCGMITALFQSRAWTWYVGGLLERVWCHTIGKSLLLRILTSVLVPKLLRKACRWGKPFVTAWNSTSFVTDLLLVMCPLTLLLL